MANNRCYLRDKKTGEQILLAKYFPDGGWYMYHTETEYDRFFDETVNDNRSLFGRTDLELVYEEKNN